LDRRPWADWGDLEEVSMLRSFRLRSEMMPYLYTSAWQATKDTVPFIRPLYIDFPDVEQAYHNGQEYLFGDNLLVAPITQPGVGRNMVASQAVWFPKGDWYDFFNGESFTGPTEGIAADPLDSFPLYVRGGVPLPMQTYTHRPGTAPLTDLVLRCYPGQDGQSGSSVVYEDDGETRGYEHGACATTKLTYVRHGDDITISVAPTEGTFKGQPTSRRCVVELPDTAKLTSCSQASAQTTYDDKLMMNRIELPEASVQAGWTLDVHAAAIDPSVLAQRAVAQRLQDLFGKPYEVWRAKNVPVPAGWEAVFAAAKGVSLIEQRQHPYFLDSSAVLLYCHNHQTAPDAVRVTVGNAAPTQVSLRSGDPVPGAPAPTTPTGVEYKEPAPPPVTVALTDPSFHGLVLREADLHTKVPGPDWLDPANDLALKAQAEASSGNAAAAIDDNIVAYGYKGDMKAAQSTEWVANGAHTGAWIKLTWAQPIQANTAYFYDRPNQSDQVLAGTIEFDDGTKINTAVVPNDGMTPLRVTFPSKTIHWLKFTITQMAPESRNIGLSEIAVTNE
jgi:hypothetical protein